jgi:demethylspheroidene O-methyltransferase
VLHDHDNEAALQILSAARLALPAGGTLLIAEPMAQTPGAGRVGDAYFGFYFMAMGQGRARPQEEIASLLQRAGFLRIRRVRTRIPLIASLTVAQA